MADIKIEVKQEEVESQQKTESNELSEESLKQIAGGQVTRVPKPATGNTGNFL